MTNANSLYDVPTREIYLLENVSIHGRKTELRQLLKLLNLAKTGQPKAALITGDAGIGKSALLEAFVRLVHAGVYCRVLDLGKMKADSPEALYVAIMDTLLSEANHILDDALIAVNEITRELDIRWERQDLARAIALVKLQESIGGKDAVSQEQLVKAIRSQVPVVKKLRFSVNESIEKLVDLIMNPWVMVATSLLTPMNTPLQEAIRLTDTLRTSLQSGQRALPPASPVSSASPASKESRGAFGNETGEPSSGSTGEKRADTPLIIDASVTPVREDGTPLDESPPAPGLATRIDAPPKSIRDPLIRHLMTVFNFVNTTIENIDTALLLVIDEWDRIQQGPRQSELKEFLSELLYHLTERKNYRMMVVMTARTEGESYTLGGPLYNHFRTKLLLDAMPESACRKLFRATIKGAGAGWDEPVHQRMFGLSMGNPFWHLKLSAYLKERLENNRVRHVDMNFFDMLGVEDVRELLELGFTRLKLAFLNKEEALYKVIAALLKRFGEESFPSSLAVLEISASQGFTDAYVFDVLRALFRHDFIRQVETPPMPERRATDGRALTDHLRRDLHYAIQSRFVREFLQEKTRAIETDISTDEKMMYLKKIIPLSVESGDLDREKTQEVLALGDALGNADIANFLEETFLDALDNEKAVVRVTALNNIALIDSPKSREALLKAMRDSESLVREYAARNLAMISRKTTDPLFVNRIVEAMLQAIDDESEAVRAQVYDALSRYRGQRDLTSVFIKGLSDACDTVRLTSIKNLTEMEAQSPYIFTCLMDAIRDATPEVRRYACIGLQAFATDEAIDAIVSVLQNDMDGSIRALAADSLSGMENEKAFSALVHALNRETDEDVRLAAARALGKRSGWRTESVLQETLQSLDWETMPAFAWACVRSLGQVGGTERSQSLLADLKTRIRNPIILSAIDLASRRLGERIGELHRMERQLIEATPLTVAVPSEYNQEVEVPEEELPDEDAFESQEVHAEDETPDTNEAEVEDDRMKIRMDSTIVSSFSAPSRYD